MTLNDNGTVSNIHRVLLSVPDRQVFGGCQPSPVAGYAYVCGWGGYTSRMTCCGRSSIGPTMFAIPDPAIVAEGAMITVKTILTAQADRGYRKTLPQNYFDCGGACGQQSTGGKTATRPAAAPPSGSGYLSPNAAGVGYMVWGDSYWNTGINTGRGFLMVASLCKGKCWYGDSTLYYDARQFELHIWDPATLTGANILQRPTSMSELILPNAGDAWNAGDGPATNASGATYADGKLFVMLCGWQSDQPCGLFQWRVGSGTTPVLTPTDAVVSDWSAWAPTSDWSACANGTQTRPEQRTRTVITPASNGGATPSLSDTRTATQACTVSAPPSTTDLSALVQAEVARQLATWPKPQNGKDGAPGANASLPSGALLILLGQQAPPAGTTAAGIVVRVN
jgi:hypothetical protein